MLGLNILNWLCTCVAYLRVPFLVSPELRDDVDQELIDANLQGKSEAAAGGADEAATEPLPAPEGGDQGQVRPDFHPDLSYCVCLFFSFAYLVGEVEQTDRT